MVYEFRDITKLPPFLNRAYIFILLVKPFSPRVSLYHPRAAQFLGPKQFTLYLPRFGACSALGFFFNILAFPGSKTSLPCY